MATLTETLTQLETRLQALVEGGLARLFNRQQHAAGLRALAAALRANLRQEPGGQWRAPHRLILHAHPALAARYLGESRQIEELAGLFTQLLAETGISLLAAPAIQIDSDETLAPGECFAEAYNPAANLSTTAVLPVGVRSAAERLPSGAFLMVAGGQIFPLAQAVVNLGRSPDSHLVLADGRVSRNHAQIRLTNGRFVIFDLNSTGGTFVNQQRIHQQVLQPGDVISLAGVMVIFGVESAGTGPLPKPGSDSLTRTQQYQAGSSKPVEKP